MYLYRTYFNLTNCVNDVSAARDYLTDDDMTVYLKNETRIPENVREAVVKIEWRLNDEWSGYIDLTTNCQLSAAELKPISEFVSGQNSDGLGEGFSQQDFAWYEDEGLIGYEGEDWDNEMVEAEFDWETNEYLFELVKTDE